MTSVFYPNGIEWHSPPRMHYLHVGCWSTTTCDYYLQRKPEEGELKGHSVHWLHNANPRDRFVFLIDPVELREQSMIDKFWALLYGHPPYFACRRSSDDWVPRVGVEAVEVHHSDITAMDYSPGLTSSRLALETTLARSRWFPSRAVACSFYDCAWRTSQTPSLPPSNSPTPVKQLPHQQLHIQFPPALLLPTAQCGEDSPFDPLYHPGRPDAPKFPTDAQSASVSAPCDAPPPPPPNRREKILEATRKYTQSMMVVVYSWDPHFNAVLREVLMPEFYLSNFKPQSPTHQIVPQFTKSVQEQRRLLAMYEAGMPSWTIFFVRWGLPYRRWVRWIAVLIYNIWPLIALCVGLYDLYKHVPYVREFLAETFAPWSQWMDEHFALRISALATYIFTVSFNVLHAAHAFLKSLIAVFTFVLSPLYPILTLFALLRYPAFAALQFLRLVVAPLIITITTLGKLVYEIAISPLRIVFGFFRVLFHPIRLLFSMNARQQVQATVESASILARWWRQWINFWDKVARPIKNVLKACYDGIVHVGTMLARREASLRRWYFSLLRRMLTQLDQALSFLYRMLKDGLERVMRIPWPYLTGLIVSVVAALCWLCIWWWSSPEEFTENAKILYDVEP